MKSPIPLTRPLGAALLAALVLGLGGCGGGGEATPADPDPPPAARIH